ncbi:MAG: TIGR04255 family protein [Proteobacteria bacterium]|nr:TIGR04255 family protein [Pseudomonadota bacterium]MBU4258670.1 TIGR04255 family protein [Pseudomonadota bacterium]MBU4288516.1 TIGR04255 family protein [Pseudomonadota bacterium]MBU4414565.1 TIGR04255 family protein [Pseudomonadota bacterium]MCG2758479.1 TIGR04255 family protein [Desulfobacteraceae bacterium]
MDIPTKITPCPIVEAIVELRFVTNLPDDAVFGVIYNKFHNEFEGPEKLPVLQLPEAIRSQDPNLIYMPYYKLHKSNYIMQVGPKVFSLANVKEYVGWDTFSDKIKDTFEKLSGLGIVDRIERFGLRYINFFADINIYEKSMLKIQLENKNLFKNENNLTIVMKTGDFASKLILVNNAQVKLQAPDKIAKGSIIDIDVSLERKIKFEHINELIENAHKEEKKLFFSLLNPDFLKTFDPKYGVI